MRLRWLSLVALTSFACASGEGGVTGFTSSSFESGGSAASDTEGPGTDSGRETDSSAETGNGSASGVDTLTTTSGSGPDPDTGSETGSDPDTGESDDCVPQQEVCNGMDDDCDGVVDNGNPGGGEACDSGLLGVCAAGETVCEGGEIVCDPLVEPQSETCNGMDDDCDGVADNGNPGGGMACNTGLLGVCGPGTTQCASGQVDCVANQQPSPEVCNGLDDNCNGQIDEGNPGGGAACNTGLLGICAAGTMTCSGGSLVCQQNNQALPQEICGNGLDDNCNGQVDEGCGCPFGLCQTPGQPMINGCDPCVTQVCGADPYCCATAWDSICVNQVASVCGQATCVAPACAHLVCVTGSALSSGCHSCVASICAADPFCCNTSWDNLCVGAVGSVCGLTC